MKNAIEAALAGIIGCVHGKGAELHSRVETHNARYRTGETFRLRERAIPIGMLWKQIGRDEECGFSHVTPL